MGEFVPIDLEAVPEEFAASTDATIGIEEEDIVVGVLAVPTAAAQPLADQLVVARREVERDRVEDLKLLLHAHRVVGRLLEGLGGLGQVERHVR